MTKTLTMTEEQADVLYSALRSASLNRTLTEGERGALAILMSKFDRADVLTLRVEGEDLPAVDHWGSDTACPVEDWQHEVAEGDTRLGYHDWVRQQKEIDGL